MSFFPGAAEPLTHPSRHPSEPTADEERLADAGAQLDAIEAALTRLDDGSFERCTVCGGPVGRDRLRADPLVTRCATHAGPPPARPGSEGAVTVLPGHQPLPFAGQQP